MGRGIGLNDANRLPWLKTLHNLLLDWQSSNKSGVLACSALKQKYRHLLNSGVEYSLDEATSAPDTSRLAKPFNVNLRILFVYLNIDKEVLAERLNKRTHEIVKGTGILDSQFEALELPKQDDCVWSEHEHSLFIEKSSLNNTYYYYLKLRVIGSESVDQELSDVVNFLPIYEKFTSHSD
jgi:gluconate kinase